MHCAAIKASAGQVKLRSNGRGQETVVTVTDRQGNEVPIKGITAVRWEIAGRGSRGRLVLEVLDTEVELDLLPEDVVVIPQPKPEIPF